jgi:hypothetical protein
MKIRTANRFHSYSYVLIIMLSCILLRIRLNCCWSSPAHQFLVSCPVKTHDHIFLFRPLRVLKWGLHFNERRGMTTTDDALTTYNNWLLNCGWSSSPARIFLVSRPTRLMTIIYCPKALGTFRLSWQQAFRTNIWLTCKLLNCSP